MCEDCQAQPRIVPGLRHCLGQRQAHYHDHPQVCPESESRAMGSGAVTDCPEQGVRTPLSSVLVLKIKIPPAVNC